MADASLTTAAEGGYDAEPDATCPHFASTPSGMAWMVGRWLRRTGRPKPRDVSRGRGYCIYANDMRLRVDPFSGEVIREA